MAVVAAGKGGREASGCAEGDMEDWLLGSDVSWDGEARRISMKDGKGGISQRHAQRDDERKSEVAAK